MIDAASLLIDTKALVRALVDNLRSNADGQVIDAEYQAARTAGRTAMSKTQWAEGLYAQVAVSWVLGCVFVRFCEDNGLVADALLGGPGNRRDLAREHRAAYLRDHPAHDDRDWLREVFTRYRRLPATGDLFGDHNPLWLLEPSADATRDLLDAFQRIDPDTGTIAHDFTDSAWDSRFLGDLYQNLSDHAKKQYALLQTPVFVEEFILDHTLEPAIATFGLRDTDLIDPTCGSGHFLLGAFDRLFKRWIDAEPGTNPRELARRALDAIAGVDVNPFAVAIARFRLLVAALRAGGDRRLADAPSYPINIAVGDSLLHRETQLALDGIGRDDDLIAASAHGYATEDADAARVLLSRKWSAVVGNPPYITVKDPALNALYRKRYKTCRGKYSLGVPFTERFWQLARSTSEAERAGYIGLITTNSFMKREMGKDLIEKWFPKQDVTHVIDTSGAYIPGHGTPTVILLGRNRIPVASTVRAVQGIRGEPSTPADPAAGHVWMSVVRLLDSPGNQNEFVGSSDIERTRLATHPWSIGGGGVAELTDALRSAGDFVLSSLATSVGYTAIPGEDDIFFAPTAQTWRRRGVPAAETRAACDGRAIRGWIIRTDLEIAYAYDVNGGAAPAPTFERWTWPWRSALRSGLYFGKTRHERGLRDIDFAVIMRDKVADPRGIAFNNMSTHPEFAVDESGLIFDSTAMVIKVEAGMSVNRMYQIAAVLNSSVATFFLKQVTQNRGASTDSAGARVLGADSWDNHFEWTAKKIEGIPIPKTALTDVNAVGIAERIRICVGEAMSREGEYSRTATHAGDGNELIALQEELDWVMYRVYGLIDEDLTYSGGEPPLHLGQRAFEIVLARAVAAGDEETTWFARHRSTPTTELPTEWPEDYKQLVNLRIEAIAAHPEIALVERPEYKRRWNATPWESQQADALRTWLVDRLESPAYWPSPSITSTARLAALARADEDFMTAARMYAGRDDVDLATLVAELVKGEAVPYLAALRYKDSGLRKWEQWLETWALQRREDAGEDVGDIPVPPRYTSADFQGVAWTHRGKLDVPKERFISYPGAERETDPSLLVGWAGWDHLERARALATWYMQAKRDGRNAEHLRPLLAGLAELVPWLRQWHDEPHSDPAFDRPGSQIAALVDAELRGLNLVADDLTSWRPASTGRGRSRR